MSISGKLTGKQLLVFSVRNPTVRFRPNLGRLVTGCEGPLWVENRIQMALIVLFVDIGYPRVL